MSRFFLGAVAPRSGSRSRSFVRWQDMRVAPDYYVGGTADGPWLVYDHSVPIAQRPTREEAEILFRQRYPGQPVHVYADGAWVTGQPAGTSTWDEILAAQSRQRR